MKDYTYYLFDFDGTLCDSTEGIINSVIYALKCYGIEETDREKLKYFIGPPLFQSFKDLYNVSDEDSLWLVEKYRERYRADGYKESEIYDGVKDMLKNLKARGKKIAVASSKPKFFVEQISENIGISEYYDFISAEKFSNTTSSKKDLINACLEFFGNPPKSEVLMVGDRHFDINGAKDAGCDSAGAVFGLGEVEELTEAGATWLLYKPEDIFA